MGDKRFGTLTPARAARKRGFIGIKNLRAVTKLHQSSKTPAQMVAERLKNLEKARRARKKNLLLARKAAK